MQKLKKEKNEEMTFPVKVNSFSPTKLFRYCQVIYEEDNWADSTKYLPADFDLVFLKTDKGIKNGWHTGIGWDGKNVKADEKVYLWKLNYDC